MYKFLPILVGLILCLGLGNAVADELEELRLQLMEAKELVAQMRMEAAQAERERQMMTRFFTESKSSSIMWALKLIKTLRPDTRASMS